MIVRLYTLALLLVISSPAFGQDQGAGLRVGDVVGNNQEQVINGWQQMVSGNYQTATSASECCSALFQKGDLFLVAITTPVARAPSGGIMAERIVATKIARPLPGEEWMECNLMWLDPLVSFYNAKTKMIRSVFYNGSEFAEARYAFDAEDATCEFGD